MDSKIEEQIDELLDTFTGGSSDIASFVSEKNTNIKSVQFVIKTDGIHMQETEDVLSEDTKTLSVWEKLLNLFGLY